MLTVLKWSNIIILCIQQIIYIYIYRNNTPFINVQFFRCSLLYTIYNVYYIHVLYIIYDACIVYVLLATVLQQHSVAKQTPQTYTHTYIEFGGSQTPWSPHWSNSDPLFVYLSVSFSLSCQWHHSGLKWERERERERERGSESTEIAS